MHAGLPEVFGVGEPGDDAGPHRHGSVEVLKRLRVILVRQEKLRT